MIKTKYGNPGDWYEDEYVGGFVREDGSLRVEVEKKLKAADTDAHAVAVQNGEGFYNSAGEYVAYGKN